jgi:hypothetical protein
LGTRSLLSLCAIPISCLMYCFSFAACVPSVCLFISWVPTVRWNVLALCWRCKQFCCAHKLSDRVTYWIPVGVQWPFVFLFNLRCIHRVSVCNVDTQSRLTAFLSSSWQLMNLHLIGWLSFSKGLQLLQ